ncbi:CapA family protein [Escherichia coli]|uniref:CapA family protein n=1 Tax=Escherichia coli TaxID=562 RepID=UPI00197C64B0|nr:CapA family protein [Escherichia coli]
MKINFFGDVYFSKNEFSVADSLIELLKSADRNIINLEAPIVTHMDNPREKVGAILRHDVSVIENIKKISATDICVANNHYFDFGVNAALNSSKILEDNGFSVHGMFGDSYQEIISDDEQIRLAVFNVAESEYGVKTDNSLGFTSITDPNLFSSIANALKNNFIVVFIIHAGLENVLSPLRSWSSIYKTLIDFGVTAIIAHHPHVPQRYERYKNGVIFYSLGNFIFQGHGIHKYNNIGQIVSFEFTTSAFEFKVHYVLNENNQVKLYSKANELDYMLNHKIDKFYSVTRGDYNRYRQLDYKRLFSSLIQKSPFRHMPYFKTRSKREFDFHLHNLRFETHRFVQLEYLEDMLK